MKIKVIPSKIKIPVLKNQSQFFDFLVMLLWVHNTLILYFQGFWGKLPILNIMPGKLVVFILYFISVLGSARYMTEHITAKQILFFLCFYAVYFLQFILFPQNTYYLEFFAKYYLLYSLPMMLVGFCLNLKSAIPKLYKLSTLSILSMLFYHLVYKGGSEDMGQFWSSDMVAAYNLVPHLLLVILFMFIQPKATNVIISLVGFAFLFSMGCRGAVLVVIVFAVVFFAFIKKSAHPIRQRIFLMGGILLLLLFSSQILKILQGFILYFGMSVRIIDKLIKGDISNGGGRESVYSFLFRAIIDNPIFGYGMRGDSTIMSSTQLTYAHNLFLEIFIDFGVIFGGAILIGLFNLLYHGIKGSHGNIERGFVSALSCFCVVQLLVSGTYMSHQWLYFLIGICFSIKQKEQFGKGKHKT